MTQERRPSAPKVSKWLPNGDWSSNSNREQHAKRPRTKPREDREWILPWKKPEPDGEWPLKRYPNGDLRADLHVPAQIEGTLAIDTSKPTNIFKPTGGGTTSSLSIAIPGSILTLAKTFELKAQVAARIARAAAVFCVDEIVIFNDGDEHETDATDILLHILQYLECPPFLRRRLFPPHDYLRMAGALPSLDMPHHLRRDEWCQYREAITINAEESQTVTNGSDNLTNGTSKKRKRDINGDSQYEIPTTTARAEQSRPKKRKSEPRSITSKSTQGNEPQTLNFAQLLRPEANPVPPPPSSPISAAMRIPAVRDKAANRSIVDCGFPFTITVPTRIPPNTRVTIRFPDSTPPPNFPSLNVARWYGHDSIESEFRAAVVDATAPKERDGYYWGYDVRVAENLTRIFGACPFDGGYDITIGTSERGVPLSGIIPHTRSKVSSRAYEDSTAPPDILPEKFNHALIVFGGVAGLEKALEYDQDLQERLGGNKMDVSKVFDFYVNAVPGQGSRTIRSEEAVWIVLGMLDAWIKWAKR